MEATSSLRSPRSRPEPPFRTSSHRVTPAGSTCQKAKAAAPVRTPQAAVRPPLFARKYQGRMRSGSMLRQARSPYERSQASPQNVRLSPAVICHRSRRRRMASTGDCRVIAPVPGAGVSTRMEPLCHLPLSRTSSNCPLSAKASTESGWLLTFSKGFGRSGLLVRRGAGTCRLRAGSAIKPRRPIFASRSILFTEQYSYFRDA